MDSGMPLIERKWWCDFLNKVGAFWTLIFMDFSGQNLPKIGQNLENLGSWLTLGAINLSYLPFLLKYKNIFRMIKRAHAARALWWIPKVCGSHNLEEKCENPKKKWWICFIQTIWDFEKLSCWSWFLRYELADPTNRHKIIMRFDWDESWLQKVIFENLDFLYGGL